MKGFQFLKYVEKTNLYWITNSMKENNKIIRIIVERSTARLIVLFLSVINISITQQIGNTQFTNISSIYPNPVPLAKASPVSTLIIPLKRKAKNKQPNESIFSKIRLNKVILWGSDKSFSCSWCSCSIELVNAHISKVKECGYYNISIKFSKVVCLFLEWKEDSENNRKTSADS